jgi:8-oxo-dGTP pyrophosphatase MutT (NUDIX family)
MSFIVKGKKRIRVASVAVINDGKILMGQRRDNNRWTLPGGHIEEGETSLIGGQRELLEETGIGMSPQKFKAIGYSDVLSYPDNKPIRVYAFKVKYTGPTTMQNDPDGEVKRWHWFDMKNMPDKVMKNMHVKGKNVVLDKLGIDHKFIIKSDKIKGGLADNKTPKDFDKKRLVVGVKVEKEHTSDDKVAEEIAMDHLTEDKKYYVKLKKIEKSETFVINLVKAEQAGQHKYIRKFRKGGKWVYIYYEAKGRPGRAMSEEASGKVARLEELGKNIATEHDSNHIRLLRELAKRGHQKSKDYLDHHQVPHEHDEETANQADEETTSTTAPEETDELKEELGLPALSDNPLDEQFGDGDEEKLTEIVNKSLKSGLTDHLFNAYATSDVTKKLKEIYTTHASIVSEITEGASSTGDILRNIQTVSNKIKDHLKDMSSHSHSNAGVYGEKLFAESIKQMESKGIIPSGYGDVFKMDTEELPNPEKIEEERQRVEAERLAKLEEQRAGITGTMAYAMMSSYVNASSNEEKMINDTLKLDESLRKMFGKDLKKEDWPYDFSAHDIDVKITSLSFRGGSINLSMTAYNKDGEAITSRWSRNWTGGVNESKTEIYNDYLIVNPEHRGKNPIGTIVNMAQLKFLKDHAHDNGQIAVFAALSVGGYNWANQGFEFKSSGERGTFQTRFQRFLKAKGINLSDSEMKNFKLPAHFAAFHDGKYYESRGSAPLSKAQKEHGNLEGKAGGQTTLKPSEISDGKTKRFHLGKAFLLGSDWKGVMKAKKMTEGNEQYDHFKNYSQLKLDAWQSLSPAYKETVEATRAGDRSRPTSATSESAPTRGSPPPEGVNTNSSQRALRRWLPPRGRRNVTINEARLRRMSYWTPDDFDHFIANASMTADGKARVRAKKREVHG